MGKKSLVLTTKLRQFCRVASDGLQPSTSRSSTSSSAAVLGRQERPRRRRRMAAAAAEEGESEQRVPLEEVVSDCVRRWFHDTLKEARAGDTAMQVLLGQMYYSGYGVPRNAQKGKVWMTKAAHTRSSVWKVSNKRPGYNASDSDSDEVKVDVK